MRKYLPISPIRYFSFKVKQEIVTQEKERCETSMHGFVSKDLFNNLKSEFTIFLEYRQVASIFVRHHTYLDYAFLDALLRISLRGCVPDN